MLGCALQQTIRQLRNKHRKVELIIPTVNLKQQFNQQFNLTLNQSKILTKVLRHNIE